jgi:TPR repeat protein
VELGATFDPFVLRQRGVIGIQPDIAIARKWYQRATELGSAAAIQQLARLNSMH